MSFPRYPAYKDSGVEWLGEVPGHWDVSRLGFESWVRARLGWKGLKADEYVDEGFAFLATPNIKSKEIDFKNVNFITQDRFDESPEIKISEGDVLLAKDGSTLGTVNVVRNLPRPTTVNSSIAVITPNADLSGVFLFYLFASSYMEQTIQRTKGGMGVPHLFQADLNKFYMPLPVFLEQIQIAAFLDRETAKIDALVAEQRRLMALLKEKRQAVISHAVTRGLNPDAPLKPSGIEWLGDVPEHWEVSAIKRYTDKITDGAHVSPETEDGVFHFVSTKDVGANSIDFENCLRTSEQSYESMVKTGCRPMLGDVLFSKDGTIGRTVVIREERDFVVASSLIIIRPTAIVLDSDFLNCLCQSQGVANQVDCFVKGAGLPRLSIQNLTKVVGCFPPICEQKAIAEFLGSELAKFDTLTTEAQRAIDLLQERRTALISAAVTGQIDVRDCVNHTELESV